MLRTLCLAKRFCHDADIDECRSIPCRNGGVCRNEVDKYTCSCSQGFTGTNCQTHPGTSGNTDLAFELKLNKRKHTPFTAAYIANSLPNINRIRIARTQDVGAWNCNDVKKCKKIISHRTKAHTVRHCVQFRYILITFSGGRRACASSPCKHRGICVVSYFSGRYRCRCRRQYTGNNCGK